MRRHAIDVEEHKKVRAGGQYVSRDPDSAICLVGNYTNVRLKSPVSVALDSLDRTRTYDARVYQKRDGALQPEGQSYQELSLEAISEIALQPEQRLIICESARSKRRRTIGERVSGLKRELKGKLGDLLGEAED